MSNGMTTGEMLDRLRVNEIAENEDGQRIKKHYRGFICLLDNQDNYLQTPSGKIIEQSINDGF